MAGKQSSPVLSFEKELKYSIRASIKSRVTFVFLSGRSKGNIHSPVSGHRLLVGRNVKGV